MESLESAGALSKADNGRNESESTATVTERNVDNCVGAEESLVMSIDNNDDKQSLEAGTVALDEVKKVVAIEPITNKDEVSETKQPSDAEAVDIQESSEVPTTGTPADDSSVMETTESVETVPSTENQPNEGLELNTVESTGAEANVSGLSNEKSVAKLDDVSVTRPVGSLGLLVQYVSSSDDDDDESGSDNANLDAQAKDLFNKAILKGDYRDADDDDDSDELVNFR